MRDAEGFVREWYSDRGERLAARRRRLLREPRSVADMEEGALTLMEYMMAIIPSIDHEAAELALALSASPKTWETLMVASEVDPLFWKTCQHLVRLLRKIAPNLLAASPLWGWALDVAQGHRVEPKKRGRPKNLLSFDLAIAVAVVNIADIGHRDASTSNPDRKSAARLVAERAGLSHRRVVNIWQRHKDDFTQPKEVGECS